MEPDHDANYYRQKSEEYRIKAKETSEPRTKAALEAVAQEYARRVNEPNSATHREDCWRSK